MFERLIKRPKPKEDVADILSRAIVANSDKVPLEEVISEIEKVEKYRHLLSDTSSLTIEELRKAVGAYEMIERLEGADQPQGKMYQILQSHLRQREETALTQPEKSANLLKLFRLDRPISLGIRTPSTSTAFALGSFVLAGMSMTQGDGATAVIIAGIGFAGTAFTKVIEAAAAHEASENKKELLKPHSSDRSSQSIKLNPPSS